MKVQLTIEKILQLNYTKIMLQQVKHYRLKKAKKHVLLMAQIDIQQQKKMVKLSQLQKIYIQYKRKQQYQDMMNQLIVK